MVTMERDDKGLTRRAVMVSAGAALLAPREAAALVQQKATEKWPEIQDFKERTPQLEPWLVKKFVIAAHANLKVTKEMLAEYPALLNAGWDWGSGDFERAIEGAGHMGNAEIAHFLLDNGARMNIFCGAMLGHLEFVKSAVDAYPSLLKSKGPHGLDLMHHARAGKAHSKHVLEWLEKHS